jgi:hypothetical protein
MRAIGSGMLPYVFPRQAPTPIFCAATADGIKTVQTYVVGVRRFTFPEDGGGGGGGGGLGQKS